MSFDAKRITNASALTDVFGTWPTFHDAEVMSIRLDRGPPPRMESDIHVFRMSDEVTEDGYYRLHDHTLVTLLFERIDQLRMEEFNHQNALHELVLRDITARQLDVLRWEVAFAGSWGMSAEFMCESISVLDAKPFEPVRGSPSPSGTQQPARPLDP